MGDLRRRAIGLLTFALPFGLTACGGDGAGAPVKLRAQQSVAENAAHEGHTPLG